jgi:hypothetical protein
MRQLEDRAVAGSGDRVCAIEVPGLMDGEAGKGLGSRPVTAKAVQDGKCLRLRHRESQEKHDCECEREHHRPQADVEIRNCLLPFDCHTHSPNQPLPGETGAGEKQLCPLGMAPLLCRVQGKST